MKNKDKQKELLINLPDYIEGKIKDLDLIRFQHTAAQD